MNLTRDRVHSIGWGAVLLVCLVLTIALTLRVNAVKSQVHATDVRIVATQRSIDFLQTEFQTRANQQQLKLINDLEFGYKAPGAAQYVEGERQLAMLGAAPGPDAPNPIRYASAEGPDGTPLDGKPKSGDGSSLLAMASPVSEAHAAAMNADAEKSVDADARNRERARTAMASDASQLGNRLARIEVAQAGDQ
ncbi:hypothetical protein [Novosphingobium sp. 9]|uniref:hypothetical protein n=1 Tax=Novosphingobium sp. 9 TaxID=2025349 RepID=UPI0021B64873|nr:hypothetical protein [Novosphingobium sp. 9]